MDNEELKKLIDNLRIMPSETEWVEFKESNYEPELIGQYISALSNSACLHNKECGYLIYGIDDKTHEIKGTKFRPKQEKIGNQEIENWIATQLEPRIDFNIYEIEYGEKRLVIFIIDPTFNIPVNFKGVSYIRVGTYKKKLDDFPEKARKIWSNKNEVAFEEQIALRNLTSDQVLKLTDYPEYFNLLNLPLPPNKKTIIEKLTEEEIIIGKGSLYSITNFGAILFARDLNKFGRLSRKAVRVIIYKGKNRLKTIKEQQGVKGYAVGFAGLIDYINGMLPANEEIGKAFRKEVKMYPELAVRELVANALIHQLCEEKRGQDQWLKFSMIG